MKALITGASSGDLQKELDVHVKIIPLDLSQENNVYELYEIVKNEDIDILINNAGFGLFGDFSETDLETELKMINVNIKAPHILTKLFLQDFLKKDRGYILNVASSAGFMAGPHLNTYYATKNYVAKLTMAINEEVRKKKSHVKICTLCPGPTKTEFTKVAKGKFNIKETDSFYVAKYGIDKMFKGKMIIVPTLMMKLALFFNRFLPYRLQLMVTGQIQKRKMKK